MTSRSESTTMRTSTCTALSSRARGSIIVSNGATGAPGTPRRQAALKLTGEGSEVRPAREPLDPPANQRWRQADKSGSGAHANNFMSRGLRLLVLCGLAFWSNPIGAQIPSSGSPMAPGSLVRVSRSSDSVARSIPRRECNPGLDLTRSELSAISRHAGWGMLAGTVAGVAYGVAAYRGPLRGILLMWDGLVGSTTGIVIGAGVYGLRVARGYRPPTQARCGLPAP